MIQRRVINFVLLVCFVAACGASARLKVFRVNVVALNTARDAVLALSKEREKQIYASCNPPSCTKEEGYARVEIWQKKVDAVIKVIDVGYRAQHDAALLDDAKSAAAAAAAATKALDLYKELKDEKL